MQTIAREIPRDGYLVDIETEKSKLKLCEKQFIGETIAVLVKSQANLGRPDSLMVEESEAIYAVYKPTKTAILNSKDAGTIRNANSKIRLISATSLVKQLFEFSYTYTQIVFSLNNCAVIYSTPEFEDIISKYKQITQNSKSLLYNSYRRSVSTLMSSSEKLIKSNNKENSRDSLIEKLFFIYKISDICKYQFDRLSKSQQPSEVDYHLTFATVDYNKDKFYMDNLSEQAITGSSVPEHVIKSISDDVSNVLQQERKLDEMLDKSIRLDRDKESCEIAEGIAATLEQFLLNELHKDME
jgi:hypothetical protein